MTTDTERPRSGRPLLSAPRANELRAGDRVRDDFTAWAEVVTAEDAPEGRVRIEWRLATGDRETVTYAAGEQFTRL